MVRAEARHRVIGRYVLFDEIASGGMATVHLGRLFGSIGFSRIVAIKRLHAQLAKDPAFVAMFVDEARLAVRVRHPNVVPILDVVSADDELFLVMEYVEGEALSRILGRLREQGAMMPTEVATSIVAGALHGLHAAHEAKTEDGEPLHLVHRDVSPHNILVGLDGVSRVFDFGIAKAIGRLQTTQEGQTKGKLAYMSPEQARGLEVDRRTDVYAASVVLWEALAGRRLYAGDDPLALMGQVLTHEIEPPGRFAAVPPSLDAIVMRGLALEPDERFTTALAMALALEEAIRLPSSREVGQWLDMMVGSRLRARVQRVAEIESGSLPDVAAAAEPALATQATRSGASGRVDARGSWRSFRRAGLGVGALLVCLAAAFAVYLRTHPTGARIAPPSADDRSASPGPTPKSPVPTAAPGDSAAEPVLTSTPAAPHVAPRLASPTTKSLHASRPRPASSASCDPPFTVDANGFRHPRVECLHLTPVAP